ncbi:hypothetical protein E4Z66_03590 [Aliishimia ponticola]|uniref:Uncharacterized protein n=1 Tax=Aliishimia ponticola TaxID=2499833 RepID=A0A4S4NGB0_9RHOB|nr:hypothetical protein [Aliishimia ponticola]THH38664.1 hypothetical protein E4Z66_03590 [Aliishimia ponticola]
MPKPWEIVLKEALDELRPQAEKKKPKKKRARTEAQRLRRQQLKADRKEEIAFIDRLIGQKSNRFIASSPTDDNYKFPED